MLFLLCSICVFFLFQDISLIFVFSISLLVQYFSDLSSLMLSSFFFFLSCFFICLHVYAASICMCNINIYVHVCVFSNCMVMCENIYVIGFLILPHSRRTNALWYVFLDLCDVSNISTKTAKSRNINIMNLCSVS